MLTCGNNAACRSGRCLSAQGPRRLRTGVGRARTSYDEPEVLLTHHTEAAPTLTGIAEALEHWLWGRGPEPRCTGDQNSLRALRETQKVGMQ
jgi:hypothetical protein